MSVDLSDLSVLTSKLHLHRRSGSSTPPSSLDGTMTSVSDRTDSEREYELDALRTPSDSDVERESTSSKSVGEKRHRRTLDASERRTVFIPNLPRDATPREVANLFAFAEGFIKVQLYDQLKGEGARMSATATPTPIPGETNTASAHTHFGCFVLFETPAHALAARDRLDGLVFDSSATPVVALQARIAMKNLFVNSADQQQTDRSQASRRGSASFLHTNVIPPSEYTNGYSPVVAAHTPTFVHSPQVYANTGYVSPLGSYLSLPTASLQTGAGFYAHGSDSGAVSPVQQHSPLAQIQHHLTPSNAAAVYSALQQAYPSGGNYRGYSHAQSFGVGPNNPPCTTLFLARLEALTNEELLTLLINSFTTSLKDHKFMIDSKGQRIAFVEFDCVESAAVALQRINGYMGLACAFSKNQLNKRS